MQKLIQTILYIFRVDHHIDNLVNKFIRQQRHHSLTIAFEPGQDCLYPRRLPVSFVSRYWFIPQITAPEPASALTLKMPVLMTSIISI